MNIVFSPIARIETDFRTKFGVPRQSGLVPELAGRIVFEPPYRNADALRGLEGFTHIWLLWVFHAADGSLLRTDTTTTPPPLRPTVRPPRLGGNVRMGVFATRSPFRPNPIGLSAVRIDRMEPHTERGPIIHVLGADLMDGTPILDIKPYLPFADAIHDATGGYTDQTRRQQPLDVVLPDPVRALLVGRYALSEAQVSSLVAVLAQDPRPHYQDDPARLYGIDFAGLDIRFRVEDGHLYVADVQEPAKTLATSNGFHSS